MKFLSIGFGRVAQEIFQSIIELANKNQIPSELYLSYHKNPNHSESEHIANIREKLLMWDTLRSYAAIKDTNLIPSEKLTQLFSNPEQKYFDITTISPKGNKCDPTLENKIKNALTHAGYDTQTEKANNPDYRLLEELALNWTIIEETGQKFKDNKIIGLVDVFSNQTDVLAYLWSSITGNVKTVAGNNHIDTVRLQRTPESTLQNFKDDIQKLGENYPLTMPILGAMCIGHHGGGCTPLISGYPFKKNIGLDPRQVKELCEEKFYQQLRDQLIKYATEKNEYGLNIRDEVRLTYNEILEAMTGKDKKLLGMSVFQKISDNPIFEKYFDRTGTLKAKDKNGKSFELKKSEDHGVFIGYPVSIQYNGASYYWQMENPTTIDDWAVKDFISHYIKMHRLIDELGNLGLIKSVVKENVHEKYTPTRKPIELEHNNNSPQQICQVDNSTHINIGTVTGKVISSGAVVNETHTHTHYHPGNEKSQEEEIHTEQFRNLEILLLAKNTFTRNSIVTHDLLNNIQKPDIILSGASDMSSIKLKGNPEEIYILMQTALKNDCKYELFILPYQTMRPEKIGEFRMMQTISDFDVKNKHLFFTTEENTNEAIHVFNIAENKMQKSYISYIAFYSRIIAAGKNQKLTIIGTDNKSANLWQFGDRKNPKTLFLAPNITSIEYKEFDNVPLIIYTHANNAVIQRIDNYSGSRIIPAKNNIVTIDYTDNVGSIYVIDPTRGLQRYYISSLEELLDQEQILECRSLNSDTRKKVTNNIEGLKTTKDMLIVVRENDYTILEKNGLNYIGSCKTENASTEQYTILQKTRVNC